MSAVLIPFPIRCTPSPFEIARSEVRARLRCLVSNFEIAVAEAECARLLTRGLLTRDAIERAVRGALAPKPDPLPPEAA
jgi:hypothetical protein